MIKIKVEICENPRDSAVSRRGHFFDKTKYFVFAYYVNGECVYKISGLHRFLFGQGMLHTHMDK